jgi:N6-L-threonylcarbamoyladenine synthase
VTASGSPRDVDVARPDAFTPDAARVRPTRVLGIETSCDETSAAVVEHDGAHFVTRSLVILSQDVHRLFGGVVPELASRQHLAALPPVVRAALTEAACEVGDCDAIAVTHAPGLVGALLVGVHFAKGLGLARGVPVLPVHHMEGHLFATALEHPAAEPPFTALLVSGGHTLLLDVAAWGRYRLLGRTRDDAAGEAFDKVAKLLGLPYPGGRPLEELARDGDPARHVFSRPMLRRSQQPGDADYYDCSFSGLKTAVLLAVRAAEAAGTLAEERAHIARGFQDAVVDTLVAKTLRAARQCSRPRVVLGGGVACNGALQRAMQRAAGPITVHAPTPRLATDNAAMIAAAGAFRFRRGETGAPGFSAHAALPIPGMFEADDAA